MVLSKNQTNKRCSHESIEPFRRCGEFPNLVSYNRFVELMPAALLCPCVST